MALKDGASECLPQNHPRLVPGATKADPDFCFRMNLRGSRLLTLLALAVVIGLCGCETMSHGQQGEMLGGIIGGVAGAQVGDGRGNTAAVIVGTIAGAMIGRHIGESMDDVDRKATARVLNNTRTGEVTAWVNPDTGSGYAITPIKTYEQDIGPCREFHLDATVGGETDQNIYGTACLQADGSWLIK